MNTWCLHSKPARSARCHARAQLLTFLPGARSLDQLTVALQRVPAGNREEGRFPGVPFVFHSVMQPQNRISTFYRFSFGVLFILGTIVPRSNRNSVAFFCVTLFRSCRKAQSDPRQEGTCMGTSQLNGPRNHSCWVVFRCRVKFCDLITILVLLGAGFCSWLFSWLGNSETPRRKDFAKWLASSK